MSEIIDLIKKKYEEEIGLSFTVFESIVFFIYVIFVDDLFVNGRSGILFRIFSKNFSEIFFDSQSILLKSSITNYSIALLVTFLSILLYKKISKVLFSFFLRYQKHGKLCGKFTR